MPRIELSEVMMELPHIVACLGRCTDLTHIDLFSRLRDTMNASEMAEYHRLYETLKFSAPNMKNAQFIRTVKV